eukprot:3801369-Rhodomonas_salina.1
MTARLLSGDAPALGRAAWGARTSGTRGSTSSACRARSPAQTPPTSSASTALVLPPLCQTIVLIYPGMPGRSMPIRDQDCMVVLYAERRAALSAQRIGYGATKYYCMMLPDTA